MGWTYLHPACPGQELGSVAELPNLLVEPLTRNTDPAIRIIARMQLNIAGERTPYIMTISFCPSTSAYSEATLGLLPEYGVDDLQGGFGC